jgi:homeobox-leucine zipper protein
MASSRPRTKDFFATPTLSLSLVRLTDLSPLTLKHGHNSSWFNQWMIEFVFRMMVCVQAGAFGRNAPAATSGDEVEEADEGDGGIRGEHLGKEVEISGENTEPGSQSADGEEEDHYHGANKKKRSRKSYHRHTAEQVRIMEA